MFDIKALSWQFHGNSNFSKPTVPCTKRTVPGAGGRGVGGGRLTQLVDSSSFLRKLRKFFMTRVLGHWLHALRQSFFLSSGWVRPPKQITQTHPKNKGSWNEVSIPCRTRRSISSAVQWQMCKCIRSSEFWSFRRSEKNVQHDPSFIGWIDCPSVPGAPDNISHERSSN